MAIIGRLNGGPLEGQVMPLAAETVAEVEEQLVLPWEQGQVVYRRVGEATGTGEHDGPTTITYQYDASASNDPTPED